MPGRHRIRSLLAKFRTMQASQMRGLLYEFGAGFRAGRFAGLTEVRARMGELDEALPGAIMRCLEDQLKRIDGSQTEIEQLEQRFVSGRSKMPLAAPSPRYPAPVSSPLLH